MTATTTEYWSAYNPILNQTLVLSQYCWNVKTFGGTPRALGPLRGGDIQVAYTPGQLFRPKFPDSRTITLQMWVAGISPTTNQPVAYNGTNHQQFSDNFQTLRHFFWTPSNQVQLTRLWSLTQNGVVTLVSGTANCQIIGSMEPSMTGDSRADFNIDLALQDPYFYGVPQTANIPYNTNTTVQNLGDDVAGYSNFSITLNGPLDSPRLYNSTNGVWLQINTLINSGDSWTLDVGNYVATRHSDNTIQTGLVSHSGNRRWMALNPGNNTLILSGQLSSSGTGSITFQPPYI